MAKPEMPGVGRRGPGARKAGGTCRSKTGEKVPLGLPLGPAAKHLWLLRLRVPISKLVKESASDLLLQPSRCSRCSLETSQPLGLDLGTYLFDLLAVPYFFYYNHTE